MVYVGSSDELAAGVLECADELRRLARETCDGSYAHEDVEVYAPAASLRDGWNFMEILPDDVVRVVLAVRTAEFRARSFCGNVVLKS